MPAKNTPESFWRRVNKDGPVSDRLGTPCWVWTRAVNRYGYGQIHFAGKLALTHRLAYELLVGPIPKGLVCRHQCDNPRCVRPDHILLGTHADNVRDTAEHGRQNPARGDRHVCARLTESTVRALRAQYAAGGLTQRQIARTYGIHQTSVGEMLRGETWSHVT